MSKLDLNKVLREHGGGTDALLTPQQDYSVVASPELSVYFKNLDRVLIAEINKADLVVGCVAWLTHKAILDALAKTRCQIVVQKEDFLRPDSTGASNWKRSLRKQYDALNSGFSSYELTQHIFPSSGLSINSAYANNSDAIKCVGGHNSEKAAAFPRAHHKFVVFCKVTKSPIQGVDITPYSVWTGSFNFTHNGTNSFENAILSTNPALVSAYFNEYAQIHSLSEPLDWAQPWVAPDVRIGT